MTARTFGRKGIGDGGAAPTRRAAFLGQQRTPAERAVDSEAFPAPACPAAAPEEAPPSPQPVRAREPVPTDRSLKTALVLWFCLGLAGGHRFYLRRPLTGAVQAALFLGCWGAALMEHYWAFAGLALSCLWMVADGLLIGRLHRLSGRA